MSRTKRILSILVALVCLGATAHAKDFQQSTATTFNIKLTKIADGTDENAATITGISLSFIKQSNTLSSTVTTVSATASGGANDCVFVAKGTYNCEITATQSDTLGGLTICASYSGSYTDCVDHMVVAAASYAVNVSGNVTDGAGITSAVANVQSDTNDIQSRLPASLGTNGNMKSDVQDVEGNTNAISQIQTGIFTAPKNVAYNNFKFKMYSSTTGAGLAGLTVTCTCQKDAGSGATCTNSGGITQVTGMTGWYRMSSITATEMNGDEIAMSCTATGARDADFKILTQH